MKNHFLLFAVASAAVTIGACSSSSSSGGSGSGGGNDDGSGGGNTSDAGRPSSGNDGGTSTTSDSGGSSTEKDSGPTCDLFTCTTSADCGGIAPCFSTSTGTNYCYEQEGNADECSAGTTATTKNTSNGATVICVPSTCPTPQSFLE